MKIAIISDTHDNFANLDKFLVWARENGIEGMIHCGDVTVPETLEYLAENFSGPIKLVCGNAEIRREEFFELAERFPHLEVLPETGRWDCAKSNLKSNFAQKFLNIGFAHKPVQARKLAETGEFPFVFYGDSHKPWIENVVVDKQKGSLKMDPGIRQDDCKLQPDSGPSSNTVILANPGTLSGVFTEPTFAVLDTETGVLGLKRLNFIDRGESS